MEDNDIIKALECCKDADCLNCPRWSEEWHSGMCNGFLQEVVDLINRQKAEIEGYGHLEVILNTAVDVLAADIKSKEIKEFAKKLKEKVYIRGAHPNYSDEIIIAIDNLVKEMTEGECYDRA